jgi:molybdopterin-containing oxidoreductase family iron-sulfur binding subunit
MPGRPPPVRRLRKGNPPGPESFEVVLVPDMCVEDGRYANNGWLQELPDPITKLTWDNAAQISPASAKKLKVETGDIVEIAVNNRTLRIPVLIAPGHADQSLTISLGYGRDFAGRVGGKGVGVNAYPLLTQAHAYFLTGATVTRIGEQYPLAITQEHGSMEGRGADLVREATLADYTKDPSYVKRIGIDSHSKFD